MRPDPVDLRIGTRGSALALWQANHVAERLRELADGPTVEIVRIKTEGDRSLDQPLSAMEGKAFFTKEIEQALLEGRVDVAVHSCKDLATELPAGLDLGAVLEREDPRDVLVVHGGRGGLKDLPAGARVGTSSLRRRALVVRRRPDVELVDLRGNVPTRIQKLANGEFDAIVLAAAGVKRLDLEDQISAYLPSKEVLPAVAQGAVAVQIRAHDARTLCWVRQLDDPATNTAVRAERALLRRLEGGCQIPVGALASVEDGRLSLRGIVSSLDGTRAVEGHVRGDTSHPETLGVKLAELLLEQGGAEILAEIRRPWKGGAS